MGCLAGRGPAELSRQAPSSFGVRGVLLAGAGCQVCCSSCVEGSPGTLASSEEAHRPAWGKAVGVFQCWACWVNFVLPAVLCRLPVWGACRGQRGWMKFPSLRSTAIAWAVWAPVFHTPLQASRVGLAWGSQFRPRCKRPGVVPRHPTTQPLAQLGPWLSRSS